MPKRAMIPVFLIVVVIGALLVASPAGAQDDGLNVSIDPQEGPDGTTVTISGSGAQAGQEIVVSYSPWDEQQACDTPRGGETIDTVTAGEDGSFAVTHEAEQLEADHVGNTYFAYVPANGGDEVTSNLACFEFGATQTAELEIDIDPEAAVPGETVTITGSGAPAGEEVIVSQAIWQADDPGCRVARDGETIERVTADADGNFSATHVADRLGGNHAGYTYFAYVPRGGAEEPMSNLDCFAFADTDGARHFDQTGHWVTDRFLEFWENNGDLPVFGYPLSDDLVEDGRGAQYFERQRFELHRENDRPFDVLLGHLGRQAAQERGLLDHDAFRPVEGDTEATESCVYFDETGHRVCHGFLDYWQSYGLDLGDDGVSQRESVMLFGYPISEEFTDPETGMTVQYFERAKLEYHPDNEAPWDVIPERLGAELFDR